MDLTLPGIRDSDPFEGPLRVDEHPLVWCMEDVLASRPSDVSVTRFSGPVFCLLAEAILRRLPMPKVFITYL